MDSHDHQAKPDNADARLLLREAALAASRALPEFTCDDVWLHFAKMFPLVEVKEGRVLGQVMNKLGNDGLIMQTGAYVRSKRRRSAPTLVWTAVSVNPPPKNERK